MQLAHTFFYLRYQPEERFIQSKRMWFPRNYTEKERRRRKNINIILRAAEKLDREPMDLERRDKP